MRKVVIIDTFHMKDGSAFFIAGSEVPEQVYRRHVQALAELVDALRPFAADADEYDERWTEEEIARELERWSHPEDQAHTRANYRPGEYKWLDDDEACNTFSRVGDLRRARELVNAYENADFSEASD